MRPLEKVARKQKSGRSYRDLTSGGRPLQQVLCSGLQIMGGSGTARTNYLVSRGQQKRLERRKKMGAGRTKERRTTKVRYGFLTANLPVGRKGKTKERGKGWLVRTGGDKAPSAPKGKKRKILSFGREGY